MRLTILVAALLGACVPMDAPEADPPLAETQTSSQPPDRRMPPLLLTLTGPAAVSAGGEIELQAVIVRAHPDAAPLRVEIKLPAGVTLVSGSREESVVDERSATIRRRFRLHVSEVPQADIVVVVDTAGDGFGAHAERRYRFGRPQPRLGAPSLGRDRAGPGGLVGRPVLGGRVINSAPTERRTPR